MKTKLLLIGTLLVCLLAIGAAWVMARSEGTILVCAAKNGTLRIIADPDECKQKETIYEFYESYPSTVKKDPPCFDNTNRYVDCDNGTVHDTLTNLIWLKNANCYGKLTYSAANKAAAGLERFECGLEDGSSPGDWRLPTKEEWKTTVARARAMDCEDPALTDTPGTACYSAGAGLEPFTGVRSTDSDYYWSSTALADFPDMAELVRLYEGGVEGAGDNKRHWYYVWPVRGGQ